MAELTAEENRELEIQQQIDLLNMSDKGMSEVLPDEDPVWTEAFDAGDDAPVVSLEEQAEDHCQYLRYWQKEGEKVAGRFETEQQRILTRGANAIGKIDRRISWHENALHRYYESKGERRVVMANATLSKTKARERIKVVDAGELWKWAVRNDQEHLFRTVREPDKRAIQQFIQKTGEEPPGCSIERGEDAFKVKF
jgi:hypothetical protein